MTATANIINATRTAVMRVPVSATRFIPPPELFPAAAAAATADKDTAGRAARRHRKMGGDSSQFGLVPHKNVAPPKNGSSTYFSFNGGGNHLDTDHPRVATVYVKTNSEKGPQMQPVKITLGLSDANYSEVLSSNPPLHAGDSVVVAAFVLTPVSGSSSSPLNSRPGQGGGGRGGGRF
jgi:hypothetical protein